MPNTGKIGIVIPVHNHLGDLRRCVESVVANTVTPYAMAVVDDGSDDKATVKYCKGMPDRCGNIKSVTIYPSAGFSAACNCGMSVLPKCDYYVLLNSDAEIGTHGWDEKIRAAGDRDNSVGLMGVVSNNAKAQSVIGGIRGAELPNGYTPSTFADLVGRVTKRIHPWTILVHGFCYIIRGELLRSVGMLDAASYPHYGSEDDYSMRVWKAGWSAVILDDVFVYHKGMVSYTPVTRRDEAAIALAHLKAQWGDVLVTKLSKEQGQPLDYLRKKIAEELGKGDK